MKTKDIIPLSECRKNFRASIAQVNETGRPMFVTANGKPAAVILSPDNYDKLMDEIEHRRNVEAVRKGLEDVKHGRTVDAKTAIEKIRQRIKSTGK